MKKRTSLVVMAAGLGSRYGGIKQLEPVGPDGQIIMDYSIYDAVRAGFDRVVFIIRKDIEKEFRDAIGRRMERRVDVAYAFQELDDLPEGFALPAGRTKPWGTGHAVFACRGIVNEPFCVVNADDYYGRGSFAMIYKYLASKTWEKGAPMPVCMAGFRLMNTLSDHGSVARGICRIGADGRLAGVEETYDIVRTPEGVSTESGTVLDPMSRVSMNMWGLQPEFAGMLEEGFADFLRCLPEGDIRKEFILPGFIDGMLHRGEAFVDVLDTDEVWFGVTYREDRGKVMRAFADLTERGVYPASF